MVFWPFNAEGIDGIHQIEPQLGSDFAQQAESLIEIVADFHHQRAKVERLGQLGGGNLLVGNKQQRLHAGARGVGGHR